MIMQQHASQAWRLPKIPARYTPIAFAFYMAGIMALLMSFVIVAINGGIGHHYIASVFHAYSMAMPVAFCCVLMVRPVVVKLVAMTVAPHE